MLKNNYIINNIILILSNQTIKVFSIFALLIIGYFCASVNTANDYFSGLMISITYVQFITLCLLPIISFSTLLVIKNIDSNYNLIIRLNNKNNYIDKLIKNVFCCNTFIFVLLIMVIIIFNNFLNSGNFQIIYLEFFKTNNFILLIFTIFKLYTLTILFSIFTTILTKITNEKISIIFTLLFSVSIYISSFINVNIVNKISDMPLYIGTYFLNNIKYKNFYLNLTATFSMIIVLLIFNYLFYIVYIKIKKDVVK